ncbi:MAG: peptidoglycan-binding LysM [Nitrobacter sp. 62-13]|uniref:LysM peptidoglycan-binding domain-containing M23 family metallopeptidase n=1 Tax=Nitrobacter sp. 62-13 TaxID=1895797 RepID=UPI000963B190|nr:LysM peptidoglycan-binding domain-containing M23 family metallopeptidase [Nitrobacter sp. 62-13]OJU24164.1 MAG: peptidoglycan-binding LysM [Nitrobacter sp. 62-13]
MSRVVEVLCSRRVPQVAVLALVSIGFAGCSADMSSRLAQMDSGPQQSSGFGWQRESTGSVAPAPAAPVVRRELPQYSRSQYQSQPLPPPISTPKTYPVASSASGNGRSVHSYTPPARPIESTKPVASRDGWNHNGGTPIIVGTSDTLEGLSHRYGVSTAEILKANGYRGPRRLQPGQQLIIPKRAAAAETHAAPAAKPVAVAEAASAVHYVNRGDTLMSIARHNHIAVGELARANGLRPGATLKVGMKITVPTKVAAVAAQPVAAAAAPPAAAAPVVHTAAAAPEGPVQKVNLAVATTTPEEAVVKPAAKTAEATGALPTFRWPVRGRVIAAYGARTNGKSNDGINVAVPEGTPVKAAEDGVVAYAGNELKGYGNLILVRHPNGYVTAYAHASELLVKRGDTIKRGQVIAKSGQSGEAASPQLHFEIRKGSSPVDPLHFLSGA